MKQARLVLTALAVLMAGNVTLAVACDHSKQKQASATSASTQSSKCPYAGAAAAVMTSADAACPSSASCPHTSAADCKAHMSASAASVSGKAAAGSKECAGGMSAAECQAHMSSAQCQARMKASGASCSGKASASAAAASVDGCCQHRTAATAATAGMCSEAKGASASAGKCSGAKGAAAGVAAGKSTAGMPSCGAQGAGASAARAMHDDCDACLDMATCEQEIQSAGASTQIVPLKNGVMYVYTADSPAKVHAVQAALARRNDHMAQFASAGDKAHLCGSCKEMRGAAASGKLSREVINIEGGCLTLVTSSDPRMVSKIHAMAGIEATSPTAAKVKS